METKSLFSSQTIQGGMQLFFVVMTLLGVQITQDEQRTITDVVITLVSGIVALVSVVQVILGRIRAKRNLTLGGREL